MKKFKKLESSSLLTLLSNEDNFSLVEILFNFDNSYDIKETACDKLSDLFELLVGILNKKLANLISWFDNPEFSGPNKIAILLKSILGII